MGKSKERVHLMDKSSTSLKSRSSAGNASATSSNGQPQQRRKTPLELRRIRDASDRKVRKMSVAPNEAFIVEETMLEDLCEASGEEARDGGNIILMEEKEELLRRLSTNPKTRSVFSNQSSIRRYSTAAVTKGDGELVSGNVGAYNVTKVRRQSVHQPNMASQSEIHRLSTSINMRTEYQALNLAKKNETCPCFSSCLALF